MRVVSLLPSATEIVCALGRRDLLVGRSHECDYPADIVGLPAVSVARIDSEQLESAEIDATVAAALADGSDLYAIDEAVLDELRPDLVITQTLCRVCAVAGDGVRGSLRARGLRAEVLELEPAGLDDVLGTVARLGEVLGADSAAARLVSSLRARLDAIDELLAGVVERPDVFVAEWLDPPWAAGHWAPELVARGGGREVLGSAHEPSFRTDWGAVRAAAPELCILAPCGFDLARGLREAPPQRVAGWLAGTPALARGAVYAVDATSYFSRPGPRLVDGVELCAALLHPELAAALAPRGSWQRVALGVAELR